MKRFVGLLVFILFILVVIVFLISGWWWSSSQRASDAINSPSTSFVVVEGEPLNEVMNRLREEGIIRSSLAASIYLKLNQLETKIQAGEFTLSPSQSMAEVFATLQRGTKQESLTIPEGFRLEQIGARLCKMGYMCENGYNALVDNLKTEIREGYFFPDTYFIDKNTTREQLVQMVKKNFEAKTNKLVGKSLDDNVLILASLIEREALSTDERPTIAGILSNRIDNEWPLQVDATIQYATGCDRLMAEAIDCLNSDWWPKELTETDLKVVSAYNTYLNSGLPPAPICNPGLDSISAAANPINSDYFYYLHDPSGAIHYARTLEEHNQNIERCLR